MGIVGGKNHVFSREREKKEKLYEGIMVNMTEADVPTHAYKGRYQHAGILAGI